jgi:hypothetical protein
MFKYQLSFSGFGELPEDMFGGLKKKSVFWVCFLELGKLPADKACV